MSRSKKTYFNLCWSTKASGSALHSVLMWEIWSVTENKWAQRCWTVRRCSWHIADISQDEQESWGHLKKALFPYEPDYLKLFISSLPLRSQRHRSCSLRPLHPAEAPGAHVPPAGQQRQELFLASCAFPAYNAWNKPAQNAC